MVEHSGAIVSRLMHMVRFIVNDQSGSVTLLFLFAFMLVFGSVALAVDATRYITLQSKAREAALAAAMIAAQNRDILKPENLDAFARAFAENSIVNSGRGVSLLSGFTVQRQDASREMDVELSVQFPVTLMGIFNSLSALEITVSAAAAAHIQNTEIALVIDRSEEIENAGKLEILKAAAASFTDLIGTVRSEDNTVRLGIIPMGNQYVNVKPYGDWVLGSAWPTEIPPAVPGVAHWVGSIEEQRWCVDIRSGAGGEDDTPPSIQKFPLILEILKEPGMIPADDQYSIATSSECADMPLRPLNTDFEAMGSFLSGFTGHGKTAGGRGVLWAERLLSPDWRADWNIGPQIPATYGTGIRKILVFVGGSLLGTSSDENRIFKETCARLKTKGTVLYMIDLKAPPEASALMKECGSTAGHYYAAADAHSLNRAFKEIAQSLLIVRKVSLN